MTNGDLGANQFTFTGDRTQITFYTQTPGPVIAGQEGGKLEYQGPEGDLTFFGQEITRLDSALGTLLTVPLQLNPDIGTISITVLVPTAFGVTRAAPVTFVTVAIKTTGHGNINLPGAAPTYDVLPLVGRASQVIQPD